MPDVPHELIVRRVKHTVQRNRQLNSAEIACQMTALPRNRGYEIVADFRAKLAQLPVVKCFYIIRFFYFIEIFIHPLSFPQFGGKLLIGSDKRRVISFVNNHSCLCAVRFFNMADRTVIHLNVRSILTL